MEITFDTNYLRLLQQRSVLTDSFSEVEIEELARGMSLRRFCKDETLSREGEPADSAMVLLEGLAHVVVNEQRVATLDVGDFLWGVGILGGRVAEGHRDRARRRRGGRVDDRAVRDSDDE